MSARRVLPALLFSLCLPAPRLFAGAGEDGFRFLNAPLSARAAAMGGAVVAVADDAGSAAWNPAAWGEIRRGEVFLGSVRMADGAGLAGAVLSYPLSSGVLGMDLRSQGYGNIDGYDAGGLKSGSVEARDTAIGLGYGRAWGRRWTFGGALRQAEQKVAGVSGKTMAADVGALWRPIPTGWMKGLRLGGALRHLGGGASLGAEKTSLPRTWSVGTAYQTLSEGWVTSLALEKAGREESSLRIGQEVWLGSALALRAGYTGRVGFSDGYTLGAGFRVADAQVDYAFSAQGKDFEDVHRIGLTWRFGGPAEKLYQEGVGLLRAGRYGESILKFNEVLEVNPRHRRAVERLREAADLLRREPGTNDEDK